jgi:hypothetical protein
MRSELEETPLHLAPMFPALYKAVRCGGVVLFSDKTSGVVVKQSRHQTLGAFSTDYIDCTNTNTWQRLPVGSQITLTQE